MWWNQIFFNEDFLIEDLITPLPNNISPNKLAPNVPYSILRNPAFRSLASFLIVSLTPFNSTPESSRDLTILRMSGISSFETTRLYYDQILRCIPVSATDAAAVNTIGTLS